jgi:catechol 2,3-dioxygenase-like lactoylglutathione lyase family enzyme
MKSHLYHLQLNVDYTQHSSFYKELMTFLGWSLIFESEGVVGKYNGLAGYRSGTTGDLWFVDSTDKTKTDYDQMGMNHLSIRVEKQADVDDTITFLKTKGIKTLFETPRHRPEFTSEKDETYYQVMFTSPDNILFEVVYIGPKE